LQESVEEKNSIYYIIRMNFKSRVRNDSAFLLSVPLTNIISFNLGMQKSEGLGNKSNPYRRD